MRTNLIKLFISLAVLTSATPAFAASTPENFDSTLASLHETIGGIQDLGVKVLRNNLEGATKAELKAQLAALNQQTDTLFSEMSKFETTADSKTYADAQDWLGQAFQAVSMINDKIESLA